jgi:hypothetical protein
MKKYLYMDTTEMKYSVVEFKQPKVISDFWFGDSGSECEPEVLVFPDTKASRDLLDAVVARLKKAQQLKDEAWHLMRQAVNAKIRGDLD